MTDIQKARDVLAKWRELGRVREDWPEMLVLTQAWGSLTPLIAGTAGNSELLDALDAVLGSTIAWDAHGVIRPAALNNIAAAIIAADERMSA